MHLVLYWGFFLAFGLLDRLQNRRARITLIVFAGFWECLALADAWYGMLVRGIFAALAGLGGLWAARGVVKRAAAKQPPAGREA